MVKMLKSANDESASDKKNKIKLIAIVAVAILVLAALGIKVYSNTVPAKSKKAQPANVMVVPKPSEIYVARARKLTRINGSSRWFSKFWGLVDNAVKADNGSSVAAKVPAVDVSTTGFLRGVDSKFVPNIPGFKRLKPDSPIDYKSDRRFVVLLYNQPTKLTVPNDKVAENHLEEAMALGYPIDAKGVHWVRYVLLEVDSVSQDYDLFVEGVNPYWDPNTKLNYVGSGYHRQFVDKNKYDLDRELQSAIDSYGRWWPW
jgi:Tfp pilus assembly major pilin PilA